MQNYEKPTGLKRKSLQVINTITDFKLSDMVIDATEMAYLELFNSDVYIESSKEFRQDITFQYKLLMDTLRGIARIEREQYAACK